MYLYNPYNYHVAVRDDTMFFGREKLLTRLVGGLCAPVPISAAIFGGRRSGKTSLLSKLRRVLEAEACAAGGRCFIPCSLDLQRGRPLNDSDDFFLWVLEELGEVWEQRHTLEYGVIVDRLQTKYRREMQKGPVDAFVRAFRSLDTKGERIRLAILIDESEEILAVKWGDDLRSNLRYLLSNSSIVEDVVLVMAGSTQMYTKVTEHDSPLENILDRYPLPSLSREATLALAREPNDGRLREASANEVWRQSGGQACAAQYILHEIWNACKGQLQEAEVEDVAYVAQGFDERTRHFTTWTQTLGRSGWLVYMFLLQEDPSVNYSMLRSRFSEVPISALQSALDALLYHGLIHCQGIGRRRQYSVAGKMYHDWFVSAGKLGTPDQDEILKTSDGVRVLIERIEQHIGAQTNIQGNVDGPVASGRFESATTFGDGDAEDLRGDEDSA
jgi:DNA-binding transcriptional ArsR family regulator